MVELKKKVTLKAKTPGIANSESPAGEKVTLKKKTPGTEPVSPAESTPGGTKPAGGGNQGGTDLTSGGSQGGGAGKWIAIIVVILIVAGLAYYFTHKGDGESTPAKPGTTLVADSTQNAQADSTTEASDSTQSDEATAGDASEENVEAPAPDGAADAAGQPVKSGTANAGPAGVDAAQASTVGGDVEELAREVIRGKYGNGEVRKQQLGDRYAEIQARVNEIYRKGLVK